jgi:hypothetical protein
VIVRRKAKLQDSITKEVGMKKMTLAMFALAIAPSVVIAQQPDTTRRDSAQSPTVSPTNPTNPTNPTTTPPTPQNPTAGQPGAQPGQDTSMAQQGQQDTTGRHQGVASGRSTSGNLGLRHSQVRQLQQALKDTGCDPGPVDGIVGPRTSSALDCARSQKGITGEDNAALFQALNLNFGGNASGAAPSRNPSGGAVSPSDTSGKNPAARDSNLSPESRAVHGDSSQVGGANQGRVRPPAESAGTTPPAGAGTTGGTRPDSAQKPPR